MRTTTRTARLLVALGLTAALGLGAVSCSSSDDTTTASSSTSAPIDRTVGAASPDQLEKWQSDLDKVGCWAGAVDGTMGPETEAAIKEFQTAEGLSVDGELNPQTEASLTGAAAQGITVCTASTGTTAGTTGTTGTTAAG